MFFESPWRIAPIDYIHTIILTQTRTNERENEEWLSSEMITSCSHYQQAYELCIRVKPTDHLSKTVPTKQTPFLHSTCSERAREIRQDGNDDWVAQHIKEHGNVSQNKVTCVVVLFHTGKHTNNVCLTRTAETVETRKWANHVILDRTRGDQKDPYSMYLGL